MAGTTANISIRMDSELKAQADALFNELGMNLSAAFNIFIRQSVSRPVCLSCSFSANWPAVLRSCSTQDAIDILPGLKSEDSWEAPQAGRQLSWPRPFPSRLHRCCHGGQVSGPSRLRSLAVTVPGGGPGRLSCRQTANRSRDVCSAHGVRVLCVAASDALEADPLTAGLVSDATCWTGPARVRGDYPFDFDACEVSLVLHAADSA